MHPEFPPFFDPVDGAVIHAEAAHAVPCMLRRLAQACGNDTTHLLVFMSKDGRPGWLAVCAMCWNDRKEDADSTNPRTA